MEAFENKLWYKILRQFSLILSIKTTLVTALCYYSGFFISTFCKFPEPVIGGLWCVISGIVVLQVFIAESYSAAWLRILGSFVGSITGYFFIKIFGYHILALIFCVFFTVSLTSVFNIRQAFRLASLTAAIIIIVGMMDPNVPPFMNASARFIESVAGASIAILITMLFFPLRKKLHLLNKI